MARLKVHFFPSLTSPAELAGGTVVVIDVLRAATTIVHALAAGAREVIPCLEVDDARRAAAKLPPGEAVLGGERGGQRIEGFDLGNSPAEYTARTVGGKSLVFTTTNGTRAMMTCQQARHVLVGGFVNVSAVAKRLTRQRRVELLCAGTRGEIAREDVWLAGLIVDKLTGKRGAGRRGQAREPLRLNDQSQIAWFEWRSRFGARGKEAGAQLARELRDTRGGRYLVKIGLGKDLKAAARIDRYAIVPELDVEGWSIRLP